VNLERIAEIVTGGGVVAIPTDTVYGLACHPEQAQAAERIFVLKRRPSEMELSLLGATGDDLARFGHLDRSPAAVRLAERFWPGPLSIIVPAATPRHAAIPRHGATISLRVPAHPGTRALLALTGPLATTSANRHGEPPATTAEQVAKLFAAELDAILDGGPAAGLPSTIIDCSVDPPRLLRTGPLGADELSPYLEGSP
jgi:L-threonylcarbamoyladenylate synthase